MNNTTSSDDGQVPYRDMFAAITISIFIFGIIGNSLVMIILGRKPTRSIHEMFILNLAASDTLFLLLVLPMYVYELYKKVEKTEFFCRVIFSLQTVTYFISIFTITSMAIHRCYVIVNPYKRIVITTRTGYIWIGFVWFSSCAIVIPVAVVNNAVNGACKETWLHPSHAKIYTAALFVLQYLLPLTIIAAAYIRIGAFLLTQKAPQTSIQGKKSRKDAKLEKRRRENKQIISTLAAIVIIFAICLIPGQVAWMIDSFGSPDQEKIAVVYKVSTILDFVHACINPIIYALLTDKFLKDYKDILTKIISCGKASITPDVDTSINMHGEYTSDEKDTHHEPVSCRASAYDVTDDKLTYKF